MNQDFLCNPIILRGTESKWNTSLRIKLHEIRVSERGIKPVSGLLCLSFTAHTQIFSLASPSASLSFEIDLSHSGQM